MCGATSAQNELQAKQAAFYDQATQESQAVFAKNQAILDAMTSVYKPILEAGPSQRGFSDEEHTALETTSRDSTATNYAKAARAVNENLATQGGGNMPMPSGADIQAKEQVASSAATEASRESLEIENADWAQGHKNFEDASGNLLQASGQLSPTAYNNSATDAGGAASKTANDIAEASNSWVNAAIGAVGGAAGAYAGRKG